MVMQYKITYNKKFYKDLKLIELRITKNHYRDLKNNINTMIQDLQYMPRTHKTLISFKDKSGEYRRIIIDKYIIIYKIKDREIIISRIFDRRENYLNQTNFSLKEEFQKYLIIK